MTVQQLSAGVDSTVCVLARYGNVPQVARFLPGDALVRRGVELVVQTDRGTEIAVALESIRMESDQQLTGEVLRVASPEDLQLAETQRREAEESFGDWLRRIESWKLQLELIDLEWTLDRKLILYVLNDRGAETTRLALLVAANGLGVVIVQPVTADGIVASVGGGGGCGSGGCGSGGCSS